MHYAQHVPTVASDLDCIRRNYALMHEAARPARSEGLPEALLPVADGREIPFAWPRLLPVIKADAYGHGYMQVASALMEEGASVFASGSIQEAAALRKSLGGAEVPILSLLGPLSPGDVETASELGIIALVHSFWQLQLASASPSRLTIAVKCNTGMARLGFGEGDMPRVVHLLGEFPQIRPALVMSHLACADTENGREQVALQANRFAPMYGALKQAFPELAPSLANSAGTLLSEEIARHIGPHVCRPGIALYGGNPFGGTSLASLGAGLRVGMWVSAPIIATRDLAEGESLGYGHTYTATKPTRVGIVAAGYADYYPRLLSNRGVMCVAGKRARVLGRVSMQMTAIDLTDIPEAAPGVDAWLLGGPYENAVSIEELARDWGSISYEAFCLLGNGTRMYVS
jgi:alanine racemase